MTNPACPTCGGEGSLAESFPGGERYHYYDCPDCQGSGRRHNHRWHWLDGPGYFVCLDCREIDEA